MPAYHRRVRYAVRCLVGPGMFPLSSSSWCPCSSYSLLSLLLAGEIGDATPLPRVPAKRNPVPQMLRFKELPLPTRVAWNHSSSCCILSICNRYSARNPAWKPTSPVGPPIYTFYSPGFGVARTSYGSRNQATIKPVLPFYRNDNPYVEPSAAPIDAAPGLCPGLKTKLPSALVASKRARVDEESRPTANFCSYH